MTVVLATRADVTLGAYEQVAWNGDQCRRGRFGALRAHVDAGLPSEETVHAELGEIVAGRRPGRERDGERILFWHRGPATAGVAVGHRLWRRALERGVGAALRYR